MIKLIITNSRTAATVVTPQLPAPSMPIDAHPGLKRLEGGGESAAWVYTRFHSPHLKPFHQAVSTLPFVSATALS